MSCHLGLLTKKLTSILNYDLTKLTNISMLFNQSLLLPPLFFFIFRNFKYTLWKFSTPNITLCYKHVHVPYCSGNRSKNLPLIFCSKLRFTCPWKLNFPVAIDFPFKVLGKRCKRDVIYPG